MKQLATRQKYRDMEHFNNSLERFSRSGWKLIVAIPVGDRPTLMGDFELLMIWRQED